jgi:hypothetical protein
MGRDKAADYFMAFEGAHKAMVYEHIPWGIVHQETVTLETLRQFPIMLLPNAAILSDKEVLLLRQYVEGGGRLIVTGLTGMLDRFGQPLKESSLSQLIGAKLEARLDSQDNWLRVPAAEHDQAAQAPTEPDKTGLHSQTQSSLRVLVGDTRPDWPFLVKGSAVVYRPVTATVLGDLLKPCRTVAQRKATKPDPDWLMSAGDLAGPAILVNRVGNGTVVAFAASPDFATASELHIVEARKLLRYAVTFLDPKPLIEIAAPATVEAVVTDDPAERTMRVHLIAYNSPPQATPSSDAPYVVPALIEDAPIYRASLVINRPIKQAVALKPSTTLRRTGDRLDLMVEDIHEVIVVKY